MKLRETTPWRWGNLPRWETETRPFETFRTDMDTIHREMDRLFESIWRTNGQMAAMPEPLSFGEIAPLVDETEDDFAFHIGIELPGMDQQDVDVTLSDGMLTIRGEKKQDDEQKGADFYHRERCFGAFRRTLPIPGEVDEANIKASFKKGVLWIDLPKTEAAQKKVKHISVVAA